MSELLTCFYVADNVFASCVSHALNTDCEEIAGFFLGRQVGQEGFVWDSYVSPRKDKQSDRVEVSDEAQLAAAEEAQRLEKETGVPTKVVGWYHSHPKMTCPPSAVDLRTQQTLQYYGISVGVIFSVFNEPTEACGKIGRIQSHGFQTAPNGSAVSVKVEVIPQPSLLQRVTGSVDVPFVSPLYGRIVSRVATMIEEEDIAYENARGSKSSVSLLHSASVYCKSLACINAGYLEPLLAVMASDKAADELAANAERIHDGEQRLDQATKQRDALQQMLAEAEEAFVAASDDDSEDSFFALNEDE